MQGIRQLTPGARIAGIGTAHPPTRIDQRLADTLLTRYYQDQLRPRSIDVMHKVLSHPSIHSRYVAVDNPADLPLLKDEDPDKRIDRFTEWSVRLGAEAITRALDEAGTGKDRVAALVVNTCTGYICPGISTYLIEELGLDPTILAFDLAGSGCGGAVPNIQVGRSLLGQLRDGVVISLSLEICTATFQMGNDISLIVSNAIFADGAAAAVLDACDEGPELVATVSKFIPAFRDDVRYVYRNGQLHNRLSPQLPGIIRQHVPPVIRELAASQGLTPADIAHWAIHPGGDKMISAIQEELDLTDAHLASTREILSAYGNMSSPTVLFVMREEMAKGIAPGEWCLMVGFGAGLSVYASLLRG
jgi:predicted naringenin-chalcone synthase